MKFKKKCNIKVKKLEELCLVGVDYLPGEISQLQIPITAFRGSQKHITVNYSVVQAPFSHTKTLLKFKNTKPQTATPTKTQKTLNKTNNQTNQAKEIN